MRKIINDGMFVDGEKDGGKTKSYYYFDISVENGV
jgi:hypothetical protein